MNPDSGAPVPTWEELIQGFRDRLTKIGRKRNLADAWAELQAMAGELKDQPEVRDELRDQYQEVKSTVWDKWQAQKERAKGGENG